MATAPGNGVSAPGLTASMSPPMRAQAPPVSSMHHDIAREVGQQVEEKIRQAKYASETKVSQELQRIKSRMEALGDKIRLVSDRVQRLDAQTAARGGGGVMIKAELQRSIAKLEEVWEGEVGALKHELWQTIQAHNHNADLIKHHKDAIDGLQAHMAEGIAVSPELERINEQLLAVDKAMQREQAKQQQIDALMQRLQAVQHQLTLSSAAGVGWAGGMGMASGNAAMLAAQAAAVGAGGPPGLGAQVQPKKAAKKKAAKPATAKAAAAATATNLQLRAEAPEFVPTVAPGLEG